MALREDFERTGHTLFQWRSYIPVLFLLIILAFVRDYQRFNSPLFNQLWNAGVLLLSFIGLGIRFLTLGYAPKSTSGRNVNNQVADSLSTKGLYSTVRHPLYLGNFLIWIGIALYFHHLLILIITIAAFWLFYERLMFAEEAFLRGKFGNDFEEWAARTPAFIPSFKNYEKSDLSFSFKKAIKREYGGFFAIIFVFTLINMLGNYILGRGIIVDPFFLYIFYIGLVLYFVIRIINKTTNYFFVEGR